MINYETILSNFDDKVTLYNWLRKVEEALSNASLESVSVSQQSAGTAILTFIFADGTSVVSPALTLPQGPTGETGPQGETGNGIASISLYSESGLTRTYRIMFTDGTHFDFDVTNGSSFVNVDGQDIVPHNVGATGNITAPSIVETMSGYSAYLYQPTGLSVENKYTGIVKNGNKLTIISSLKITPTASSFAGVAVDFIIPSSIGQKLIPSDISETSFVDFQKISAFSSLNNASEEIYARLLKKSNGNFQLILATSQITANTAYYIRYEATFLLSNSLIQ